MRFAFADVVFQEVPDEVSLVFLICGCPLRCLGCHSAAAWSERVGRELSAEVYEEWLGRYRGLATCVCFFGGEWHQSELRALLRRARQLGYRTCLYTGREEVDASLLQELDYLKLGPWRKERGGLDQIGTNQRMIRLATGEILNHRFQEPRRPHAAAAP